MRFGCITQVIHVAGTRMISQGTDGLSRGNLLEGVLKGEDMLTFIPLHLSALDRQPSLRAWVTSWAVAKGDEQKIRFLTPEEWTTEGHDIVGYEKNLDGYTVPVYKAGVFVWSPPPAAARWACEELRQARHKRQRSTHIFLVPKLMGQEWRKHLHKTADILFDIPLGHTHWPTHHHENLTLAVCFPYLNRAPWEL